MSNINFSNAYLNQLDSLSRIVKQFDYVERLCNPPVLKIFENINKIVMMDEHINRISIINENMLKAFEIQSRVYEQAFLPYEKMLDSLNWATRINETLSRFSSMQIYVDNAQQMMLEMTQIVGNNNWSEEISEEDIQDISVEEYQELCEVIEDIVTDRLNWQQKLVQAYKRFKDKNPVIEGLFRYLMITIIGGILVNVISQEIGELKAGTKIKEAPTSNAPVVITVEKNIIVNIVGDEPYYYEIICEDKESKQEIRGWVSKRVTNLK